MDFHSSVAETFLPKNFFTFTKTGRRCDSTGQSVILSACITAFWQVIETIFGVMLSVCDEGEHNVV